jgi:hypothetical protein
MLVAAESAARGFCIVSFSAPATSPKDLEREPGGKESAFRT